MKTIQLLVAFTVQVADEECNYDDAYVNIPDLSAIEVKNFSKEDPNSSIGQVICYETIDTDDSDDSEDS